MTDPTSTKVALVDDHSMIRQALAALLSQEPDIEVVAQGGSCQEALTILAEEPDVLVLDYNMPDGGALDVLGSMGPANPVRVLVLTVHDSIHYAMRTIEAGAHGFLIKASAVEELVEAIHLVRRGKTYITPKYARQLAPRLAEPRLDRSGLAALSDREFDILRDLVDGRSLKETAYALGIGTSTVSTYRARLQRKLGLDSSSELIRYALENGIR